jgi:hypothetical protein
VRNDWQNGEVTVAGKDWSAAFRRGEPGVVVEAGGMGVTLSLLGMDGGTLPIADVRAPTSDGARFEATFRQGGDTASIEMGLEEDGLIQITPGAGTRAIELTCPMAVGILPGERLDDVLYLPEKFEDILELHVPSENWFAGLLSGGSGMLACAWEGDGAAATLLRGNTDAAFRAIRLVPDGNALYLRLIAIPGLWHREPLQLTYLEKDVQIEWQRPIPATYKTQLTLKGQTATARSYVFTGGRREAWIPEVGNYVRPVWFDGDNAYFRLSKRIPPKGEAVIYPYSDHEDSLMDFVQRTPVGQAVLKRAKRRSLRPGPRGAPNVGFNACWGTFLLRRSVYAAGAQQREKVFLREHADFLADYVAMIQQRHVEYVQFMDAMRERLGTWHGEAQSTETKAYLEAMIARVDDLREQHGREMETHGGATPEDHIARANRNLEQLNALCETPGTEIYPLCFELIDQFNRLSWGHSEQTGMRFCMLTRAWARDAALACADVPEALPYALEIRAAIRFELAASNY